MIETRQILEELQLKNVLATSSTGAVFLAEEPDTGDDVVIKMVSCAVPDAEEDVRQLFLSMVETARSVNVPGMPTLKDHGLSPEGDGFVVMNHVEGRTLDTLDELSPFASINALLDVLACIEGLAGAGTAHLNLNPTNIYLTNSPSFDRAVVLGFGTSATLLHAGAGVPIPAHDPHFAPELVSGKLLPADQAWRSDLFSFGVIACSVLGAEIEANGYDRPRVKIPDVVRRSLPEVEPLEEMLGRVMAPDPMLRGSSPSDCRDPLIRALPEPSMTAPAASDAPDDDFDPNKTDPAFVPPVPEPEEPSLPPPIPRAEPTVAVKAEDGWPEVLFEDPEVPASLAEEDDPDDTDIKNPVPEDVWVPVDDAAAVAPHDGAPTKVRSQRRRRVTRLELIVVTITVVVLGSIIAFTWPSGDDDESPVAATTIPVEGLVEGDGLVPPPPDTNLFDDLLSIQGLVDTGDLEGARQALADFDARDDVSLGSDEKALYDSLVGAVAHAADRDAALDDLRGGLKAGSIRMVRRGAATLRSLPAEQIREVAGLSGDLERASRVLRMHGQMWEAHREGDHLGAIRYGGELQRELPGYGGAPEVREQSAGAVIARAEAAAASHRFGDAAAIMESLERVWPGYEGVAGRKAEYERQADLLRRGTSEIEAALAMGAAGDPEGGLARLAAISSGPEMIDDVERARSELHKVLAAMDAAAPTVEIAVDMELGFKKNQSVTIPLRVDDDYRVEEVVVHARNAADDGFLRIPLDAASDGFYHFTVSPELHGNKDVSFYVVATDRAGHVGGLGSLEEPQTVVRKKWFKK